jgi:hypothetical protein
VYPPCTRRPLPTTASKMDIAIVRISGGAGDCPSWLSHSPTPRFNTKPPPKGATPMTANSGAVKGGPQGRPPATQRSGGP